jgi:hypothetical protein
MPVATVLIVMSQIVNREHEQHDLLEPPAASAASSSP